MGRDFCNYPKSIFTEWEHPITVNELTLRLLMIELLCSFFNIVHLGNSIILYELDKDQQNQGKIDEGDIQIALYISTIACIFLAVAINIRYVIELKWRKAKHYVITTDNLYSSGTWKIMLIETIISLIGPHFFLDSISIDEYVQRWDVTITYKLNHLLCCVAWAKCYGIMRTVLLSNRYTSAWG